VKIFELNFFIIKVLLLLQNLREMTHRFSILKISLSPDKATDPTLKNKIK